MGGGRSKKPPATALTLLGGGAQATSPPDAPAPEPAQKPPGLSDAAAVIWDDLAPRCTPGALHYGTSRVFAMLCTALATWQEADEILQSSGILITAGAGDDLITNPALAIRDRQDAIAGRWAKVFGLSPEATPARPQATPRPERRRHTVEG